MRQDYYNNYYKIPENKINNPHLGSDLNQDSLIKQIRWMVLLVIGLSLATSIGLITFGIWAIIKIMQHFNVI